MKNVALLAAASTLQFMALFSNAFAGTFAPVTAPSGSVDASIFGINDQGKVAGSFSTDFVNLFGFVGSIDGNYQTFDVDGNPTQARSVNNQGLVVGFYVSEALLLEFARKPDGSISDITKDGTALIGIAQGIDPDGEFVGDYVRGPGAVPLRGGFKGKNAAYVADVDLPFPAIRVAPRGINARGDIAGWFIAEAGGNFQGFVMRGGVTTVVNFPGSTGTNVEGINNLGQVSGSWFDADGNSHGFVLDSDLVTWTSFDAPGWEQTQAFQINSLGQVAVNGFGELGNAMYVYCPGNAGVCSGGNPHLPANETVVTGEVLYEPAHGQSASPSGPPTHIDNQL